MTKDLYISDEVSTAIRAAAAADALSAASWVRRIIVRDLKQNGHLAYDAPITPGQARKRKGGPNE